MGKLFRFFAFISVMMLLFTCSATAANTFTYFQIIMDPWRLYVGEAITWTIASENGSGSYAYYYKVLGPDGIEFENYAPSHNNTVTWNVTLPGQYILIAIVKDMVSGISLTKWNDPAIAYIGPRPNAVITKVEPVGTGGTALKITWVPLVQNENSAYEVWRGDQITGPYKKVSYAMKGTSFSNTYLTPGVRYYYKIRCLDMSLHWPYYLHHETYSATVAGVPLARPAILTATGTGRDRVMLAWARVPGATGYRISMSRYAAGPYTVIGSTTALGYTKTGLRPGTTYYFKLQAYRRVYTTNYYGPVSPYNAGKTLR